MNMYPLLYGGWITDLKNEIVMDYMDAPQRLTGAHSVIYIYGVCACMFPCVLMKVCGCACVWHTQIWRPEVDSERLPPLLSVIYIELSHCFD